MFSGEITKAGQRCRIKADEEDEIVFDDEQMFKFDEERSRTGRSVG